MLITLQWVPKIPISYRSACVKKAESEGIQHAYVTSVQGVFQQQKDRYRHNSAVEQLSTKELVAQGIESQQCRRFNKTKPHRDKSTNRSTPNSVESTEILTKLNFGYHLSFSSNTSFLSIYV